MIDHIDVCLCICKMTLQRSPFKFIINVIQIDTCTSRQYPKWVYSVDLTKTLKVGNKNWYFC